MKIVNQIFDFHGRLTNEIDFYLFFNMIFSNFTMKSVNPIFDFHGKR